MWHRLLAWIRGVSGWPRRLLGGPGGTRLVRRGRDDWGPRAAELDPAVREKLDELDLERGVVRDTIQNAIEDYCDLGDVINGPNNSGSLGDVVDDVMLLADAEATLLSILERAQGVESLINIAARRRGDQAGREAAGEAILRLRDDARALATAASTALSWAGARDTAAKTKLKDCGEALALAAKRA